MTQQASKRSSSRVIAVCFDESTTTRAAPAQVTQLADGSSSLIQNNLLRFILQLQSPGSSARAPQGKARNQLHTDRMDNRWMRLEPRGFGLSREKEIKCSSTYRVAGVLRIPPLLFIFMFMYLFFIAPYRLSRNGKSYGLAFIIFITQRQCLIHSDFACTFDRPR